MGCGREGGDLPGPPGVSCRWPLPDGVQSGGSPASVHAQPSRGAAPPLSRGPSACSPLLPVPLARARTWMRQWQRQLLELLERPLLSPILLSQKGVRRRPPDGVPEGTSGPSTSLWLQSVPLGDHMPTVRHRPPRGRGAVDPRGSRLPAPGVVLTGRSGICCPGSWPPRPHPTGVPC